MWWFQLNCWIFYLTLFWFRCHWIRIYSRNNNNETNLIFNTYIKRQKNAHSTQTQTIVNLLSSLSVLLLLSSMLCGMNTLCEWPEGALLTWFKYFLVNLGFVWSDWCKSVYRIYNIVFNINFFRSIMPSHLKYILQGLSVFLSHLFPFCQLLINFFH